MHLDNCMRHVNSRMTKLSKPSEWEHSFRFLFYSKGFSIRAYSSHFITAAVISVHHHGCEKETVLTSIDCKDAATLKLMIKSVFRYLTGTCITKQTADEIIKDLEVSVPFCFKQNKAVISEIFKKCF